MNEFISRYSDQLNGVISGSDRLVFRGNLPLNHEAGMKGYLWTIASNRVRWPRWKRATADPVSQQRQGQQGADGS